MLWVAFVLCLMRPGFGFSSLALYDSAIDLLKAGKPGPAIARLAIASQSPDYVLAEASLAFLRRTGRGLAESCSEIVQRLLRAALEVSESERKKELKIERKKHYLHLLQGADLSPSSDEDVVQFHEYAAASGDAHSMVEMGNFFLVGGHGLDVSYKDAFHFYESAAEKGDPRGMAMEAFMYEKGLGVEKDSAQALKLYEKAAEQNDAFAFVRLGKAYLEERLGLAANLRLADQYFTQATKFGSSYAWYGLARIALAGNDEKKAINFFAVAVQKGSGLAALALGQLRMKEKSTCAQAVHNIGLAFEWSEMTLQTLSEAYQLFVSGNVTGALRLYERLAWAGVEEAQANAGHIYMHVLEQPDVAKVFFELSAEQGNANSHKMLGEFYYSQDLNLSHTAFRRAAELNNHEAMFNLARMYEHGEGVPASDPHLAKRYYDMAGNLPSAIYAVDLALANLYITSFAGFGGFAFLWEYWNDTAVLTFLCVLLGTMLAIRARF